MSLDVFDRYGLYYDLLYRDKDYETEAKYIARALRATKPDTKTQVSDRDMTATFANAARHLRREGLFLFDVWHAPAVLSQGLSVRVKRAEDEAVRLTRTAEPELDAGSKVATVRYKMLVESKIDNRSQTFQEEHRMRYFFPAEISEFAAGSGFEIERTEELITGKAPSENTWAACYLLRKRA